MLRRCFEAVKGKMWERAKKVRYKNKENATPKLPFLKWRLEAGLAEYAL